MRTAFLTHPNFLLHDTGPTHPERPGRLVAIENRLREAGLWDEVVHLHFEAAREIDLQMCHTAEHVERVKTIAQSGGGSLDNDTVITPLSFDIAKLATGAALRAVEAVWNGEVDNAFVAERPCGHHAESGRRPGSPWGFCLFNHVAIAARHAQRLGAERVAVLDFDVHHGNGTQEIFYEDPTVFFASVHESPLFPYTGAHTEVGEGLGVGTTLNFPIPAHSEGSLYNLAWKQVGEAVAKFDPQMILLSAGYDAHQNDPLGHMKLHSEDFAALITQTKRWTQELCGGKLVAVLEGGYNLNGLADSVAATISALQADD